MEDFEDKSEPMKKSFKMTAPVSAFYREYPSKMSGSQGPEHGHYTFSQGHLELLGCAAGLRDTVGKNVGGTWRGS